MISLASSASDVVVGTSKISLQPPLITVAPVLTINDEAITANGASKYLVGSQTLVLGGNVITASGTRIAFAPSASEVVVGANTEYLGSLIVAALGQAAPPGLRVGQIRRPRALRHSLVR